MKLTVFILFLLGIQLSCVPHTYVKTESLRANIPKQYANASTPDNKKVGTQAWWKEFNDEKLDQLVTTA